VGMIRQLLRRRFGITVLVVLSLLFSQLALASTVCPVSAGDPAEADMMQMMAGEPCEHMSAAPVQEHSVLCHQHCIDAPQSLDRVQVPAATLPAIVQVVTLPIVPVQAPGERIAFDSAWQARPPPDPLFLSTLRLRV
jgi:hypothetical protein